MTASAAYASGFTGRYSAALFDLAVEQGQVDEVSADLDRLSEALKAAPDLDRLIKSPVAGREEQGKAIQKVADYLGCKPLTQKFLGLLAANGRLFAVESMIRAFQHKLSEYRGEIAAEVVSAIPLNDAQMDSLRQSIAAYAQRPVTIDMKVDPSLLGGLTVSIGSRMIDASLKSKLQKLETSMRGIG